MRRAIRRHSSVLLAAALGAATLAACSGAPRPSALRTDQTDRSGVDSAGNIDTDGDGVADTTADGQPLNPDGTPATPGATGPNTPGVPGATGPGATGPGTQQPGTGKTPVAAAPTWPDAKLFSGAANTRGISNDKIVLCAHAALIFAQAFDTRPADLNVYWDWVNRNGGIHGRTVEVTYEDDRYDGPAARDAANTCRTRNPFFILGGIGFDQIPNVRDWAEQNKELYLHHIAVGKGGENKQYSFTMQPTVEQTGKAFGEFITKQYGGKRIGIVYRDSENWEPGRAAAKAVLQANKQNIVAEQAVVKNQSAYGSQIVTMQQAAGGKGAEVVFLWENALGAAEFIKQSHNQGYHPAFVVFPFQTSLDVLGDDAMKSQIKGLGTWAAFKPGGYGGAFPEHNYEQELATFERVFKELRGNVKPNDILWQVWLGNKQLHDMFNRCGRDCTRNRFAGMMLSGYKSTVAPNCPIDFSLGGGHRGANQFIALEAYKPGTTPYFRTTQWCTRNPG